MCFPVILSFVLVTFFLLILISFFITPMKSLTQHLYEFTVWMFNGLLSCQAKMENYWKPRLPTQHKIIRLNSVELLLVQLYMCTCKGRKAFQWDLSLCSSVPIMFIRVELSFSCWPFVSRLYGVVPTFLTLARLYSSFIKMLSKFQPWSVNKQSVNP